MFSAGSRGSRWRIQGKQPGNPHQILLGIWKCSQIHHRSQQVSNAKCSFCLNIFHVFISVTRICIVQCIQWTELALIKCWKCVCVSVSVRLLEQLDLWVHVWHVCSESVWQVPDKLQKQWDWGVSVCGRLLDWMSVCVHCKLQSSSNWVIACVCI